MDDEQRINLKSLISKYRNLLKLKRKYSNVENIDNESKSDYNDEADDVGLMPDKTDNSSLSDPSKASGGSSESFSNMDDADHEK